MSCFADDLRLRFSVWAFSVCEWRASTEQDAMARCHPRRQPPRAAQCPRGASRELLVLR